MRPALRLRERFSQRFFEEQQKLQTGLLLNAMLVGAGTGAVGVVFRLAVAHIFRTREEIRLFFNDMAVLSWLVPTMLAALMVAVAFRIMRGLAPETNGSGIPHIEGFLDGLLPIRWRSVLAVKFFAGLLTLGSGMVLGREGPTIQMGGSIGKGIGDYTRSSGEQIRILVSAGAGAGLSAAFNAPMAGILFVIEEMRPGFEDRVSSIRAVTIASIMASIIVRIFQGQGSSMRISLFAMPPLTSFWAFVLLGVSLGIVGYWFNRLLIWSLSLFETTTRFILSTYRSVCWGCGGLCRMVESLPLWRW